MHLRILPLPLALAAALTAQTTTYFAPSGTKNVEGNAFNTIPWWAGSGSYQQVHDATDLQAVFPTAAVTIKGLSFRKDMTGSGVTARTMDVTITLSTTAATAATATTTFAANHGAAPTVVLPYTNTSLPQLTQLGTPNPQGWLFPFAAPFYYVVPTGNLCWELRFKNSSTTANAVLDIASGGQAVSAALIGTGCIASGQTQPATINPRLYTIATGAFRNALTRGPASSPAALFLGDTAQHIALPGFCSAVETLPLISLPGTTNASGTWDYSITVTGFPGPLAFTVYSQFAFFDPTLPNAVGVSDCSPILVPSLAYRSLSRIYYGASASGQGNEAATGGTKDASYGLVTGFEI